MQEQLQEEIELRLALASAVEHSDSSISSSPCQLPDKVNTPIYVFPTFYISSYFSNLKLVGFCVVAYSLSHLKIVMCNCGMLIAGPRAFG